jgi:hypothetical protein
MKIHNVRLGFATNSSSTHSIILLPEGKRSGDFETDEDMEFGWGWWTAGTAEAKRNYLAVQMAVALRRVMPHHYVPVVMDALWGENGTAIEEGYVDHQSAFSMPTRRCRKVWMSHESPDEEFFLDLRRFLLRDDVLILGGNDNEDGPHKHSSEGEEVLLPFVDNGPWRSRRDPAGFWTLFNPASGAKVRFSFDDLAATPTGTFAPELVDLKVTDFCRNNCRFCYQDSDEKGEHASMQNIGRLAYALGELGVFEVAIGGGEPMEHPDFLEILDIFQRNGIVANFTTRETDWLRDEARRERIMSRCGGFALSAGTPHDVEDLRTIFDYHGIPSDGVHVHIVMGTVSRTEFEEMLRTCHDAGFRATLLGWKSAGRACKRKPKPYDWWMDAVREEAERDGRYWLSPWIGIDTALAQQSGGKLSDIPKCCYYLEEGRWSCYIDAVKFRMARSSYAEAGTDLDPEMDYEEELPEAIKGEFQSWRATPKT